MGSYLPPYIKESTSSSIDEIVGSAKRIFWRSKSTIIISHVPKKEQTSPFFADDIMQERTDSLYLGIWKFFFAYMGGLRHFFLLNSEWVQESSSLWLQSSIRSYFGKISVFYYNYPLSLIILYYRCISKHFSTYYGLGFKIQCWRNDTLQDDNFKKKIDFCTLKI